MYIKRLDIKGFGRLNNLNLNLINGLNIIFGNNESGKTTLQLFIKGIFYGLKGGRSSKDGTLPDLKRYKPWDNSLFSGFIEYELDNGCEYRVERHFNNNSVNVYDSLFNDITNTFDFNKEQGALFSEAHLGINETCFDKTVFIKQQESRIDDDGRNELISKLTNILQTGFEDISYKKAQEALKEAIICYVGTDKTSKRPMDKLLSRLEELNTLKAKSIEIREKLFSIEDKLNRAKGLQEELFLYKTNLVIIKEIIDLRRNIDKQKEQGNALKEILLNINTCENELDIITSRNIEHNNTKRQLEKYSIFNDNDIDKITIEYDRLTFYKNENIRLQNELSSKKEDTSEIKYDAIKSVPSENYDEYMTNLYKRDKNLKKRMILALGSGLVFSVSEALGVFSHTLPFIGYFAAFMLFLTIIYFLIKRSGISREIYSVILNNDILRLEKEIASNQFKINDLSYNIKEKLLVAGIINSASDQIIDDESVNAFKNGIRKYIAFKPGIKYTEQRIEDINNDIQRSFDKAATLTGMKCIAKDNLSKAINKSDEKVKLCQEKISSLSEDLKDIHKFELIDKYVFEDLDLATDKWKDDFEKTVMELDKTNLEIREYETLLINGDTQDEEILRINQEIEDINQKKDRLNGINFSLRTALSVLSDASKEIQRDFAPVLNERMGRIFSSITAGKYSDLRADDKLLLKTVSTNTDNIVNISMLSRGTIDQAYFALRLAMAGIITSNGETLPIIMDEVFAQYDDIRVKETMKFLDMLSKNNQVILFTCKSREVEIALEECGDRVNLIEL